MLHEQIIEHVRKQSGLVSVDDFEVSVSTNTRLKTCYRDGKISGDLKEESCLIRLRLMHRRQPGVFSITDPSQVDQLIEGALTSAKYSSVDPWYKFPLPPRINERRNDPEAISESPKPSHFNELTQKFRAVEEEYSTNFKHFSLFRKIDRVSISYKAKNAGSFLSVIDSDGACLFEISESKTRRDPANEWLRSLKKIERQAISRRTSEVWEGNVSNNQFALSPRATCQILLKMSPWFSAQSIGLGDSPLAHQKLNVSNLLELIDHGAYEDGASYSLFDEEGVKCGPHPICKGGEFFPLYDSYWGARSNIPSTGNLFSSFVDPKLQIKSSHLIVPPGKSSRLELIENIKQGFYFDAWDEIRPLGRTHFSLSGRGWRVENGKLKNAVHKVSISVDLASFFEQAQAFGKDFEFFDCCGAPSIFLSSLPLI